MTSYSWTTGVSGDWATAADWTPATVPNDITTPGTADVTIDATAPAGASYTVTIAAGESETIDSLTLNGSNNLAGANSNPYNAAELELDGTLAFAAGSAGGLDGSLQTFVHVANGSNAEIINGGTLNGFIQVEGNLLLTGTNGVYITNDLQALAGTVTIDTKSIAEMTPATNTLFDGIFEAKGPGATVNLGGALEGLIVNIGTVQGPPIVANAPFTGWTELTWNDPTAQINEWNGTSYVSVETTLTDIGARGTVDVLAGRNYTTAKTLTVDTGGEFNLQAGTVTAAALDINSGGVVQGTAVIAGNVVNNGTLSALNGTVDTNGTITVTPGTLDITGSLTGTGTVLFDYDQSQGALVTGAGATLEVNAVSAGQTIVMNGHDTLRLDTPASFAGTIAASVGDTIILGGMTATAAVLTAGTLVVSNGTTVLESLKLAGSYTGDGFVVNGSTLTVSTATAAQPLTITGGVASQAVTDTGTILPFAKLAITDPNLNQTETVTVTLSSAANGTLTNLAGGTYNATTGVYTVTGSAAAVDTALQGLVFNPAEGQVLPGQTVTTGFTVHDTDTAAVSASDSTTTVIATAAPSNFTITDTTTNSTTISLGTPYSGPVAGLTNEYVTATTDNLAITATAPNSFIHSGSGNDAIDVSKVNGTNVLDGSTGSNFLVGGTGDDTFFLDDRGPTSAVFSTVVNFHSGDDATVFGVTPTDFTLNTYDNQGAAGYLGLDFSFTATGAPDANLVLTGFSQADLTDGKLTVTYGTTAAVGGVAGSTYMLIHAN